MRDILKTRLAARKVSLKSFEWGKEEKAFEGTIRQEVLIKIGIEGEQAKALVKEIKGLGIKVQASIQGDEVRVTSRSKDALQTVIQHLNAASYPIPLQFSNFR